MNNEKRLLTELDLKHISNLINRDPNDEELNLIENILSNELKNREYLEIISRLNKGANRNIFKSSDNNESNNLCFINGIKIYNNNKLVYNKDESDSEFKLGNILPLIKSNSYIANKFDLKFINTKISYPKKSAFLQYKSDHNCSDEILFSSLIGIDNMINEDTITDFSEYMVLEISIGKNIKKNEMIISEFIELGLKEDWFFSSTKIINGLGITIIQYLTKLNCGIIINPTLQFESLFDLRNDLSLLVVSKKQNVAKIEGYCKNASFQSTQVGRLMKDSIILYESKNSTLINLPLTVFDLQFDVNTKHFKEPEKVNYKSYEIISDVSKTSYSNQLIKLLEKIIINNALIVNGKKNINRYGISSSSSILENQFVLAQADHNNLLHFHPRMSAKIAIANAARKIACLGLKPKYILVHNLFPSENPSAIWRASEILQGQEEAIRELELTITNRKIDTYKNYWQQNVLVIGSMQQREIPEISFKDDGDFISLLGSHRGELGGTEYQRYISDKLDGTFPTVDLNMEQRLQDVVQQGINTNLLKSATNVSLGGISIAIAMSIAASVKGIGAKIHLSRKLTDEELLFGETQGLVIVTIAEEDIMEFERICMTIGVPSTTIGRVTNNNKYTFNNLIDLDVEKLRRIMV